MSTKRKTTIAQLMGDIQSAGGPTKKVRQGASVTTTVQHPSGITTTRAKVEEKKPPTQPHSIATSLESVEDNIGLGKAEETLGETPLDTTSKPNTGNRSADYLRAFMNILSLLTTWFLLHDWDPNLDHECFCGRGKRTVQCQDCQDFELCCTKCWLELHRYNPWHWARVWNGYFFVQSDISTLRKDGFAVQIGHHGRPCPLLDRPKPIKFTVVHSNGVHGTLLSFCNCSSATRVEQLMKSRLFPASALEPETAYTFSMVKEYDIHSLQGKIPAYDWVYALRRLSDNAHTHTVNDPYNSFMLVVRVWRHIHDKIRFGEFYSLNPRALPHLPTGTFVVRCPTCPDPDMNMEEAWWKTEPWHLNMMYTTLDGNSKTRRFLKKGGEGDVSLYDGKSYFPPDAEYARFLQRVKEKKMDEPTPDCDNVKVVSRLTDLATHGMAVTGTVNHQCSHVFIMGVTDMFASENQANVDAALSRGYSLYGYDDKNAKDSTSHRRDVPHKQTYDAECHYAVNQNVRFATFSYLRGLRKLVLQLERGIPVLHLTGHKLLLCKILFALFYHWCNGHFTGEGAEQAWPELNRVGTYTCQMKCGHRHDVLIIHYNDWNHKKIVNLAYIIARELVIAAAQLEDQMMIFREQSWVFQEHAAAWSRQELVPRPNPDVEKSWIDAYHRPEKGLVPSIDSVLDSIAQQDGGGIALSIPGIGKDLQVYWRRAFEAEDIRERITVLQAKSYLTETEVKSLEGLRTRLEHAIVDFRERQNVITPRLPERFGKGMTNKITDEMDAFVLGLPSEMTEEERVTHGTTQLAIQEASLRTSHAYDTVNALQSTCRKIEVLVLYKDQNVSTEKMRTRMGTSIQNVLDVRARQLAVYNYNRRMLMELKGEDCDLPVLSVEDTERKDIDHKRRAGDSKRRDGTLWKLGPNSLDKLPGIPLGVLEAGGMKELVSATKMTQRAVRHSRSVWDGLIQVTKKSRKQNRDPAEPALPRNAQEARDAKRDKQFRKSDDAGVLWTLGSRKGLAKCDQATINAFELEGDRISWSRQQAEVYRWMEEFEKKHAEFHRMIRYFRRMQKAWTTIAENPEDPANANEKTDAKPSAKAAKINALRARALRQATIWGDYATVAIAQFSDVSYPPFHDMSTPLAPRVVEFRREQFEWMAELKMQRADLMYGATKAGMERSNPPPPKKASRKKEPEGKQC
ncbi:hypothetical protein V5O48_017186 [Marasmius crinis-equi]|uniref:CxC2-like cysteine cluster KDZ transposase-associated domain-containing protein n=1 Tax=Marasmius crinis-equi TaxID=585013 RepID=A0ABR3EPP0_9AGAR